MVQVVILQQDGVVKIEPKKRAQLAVLGFQMEHQLQII